VLLGDVIRVFAGFRDAEGTSRIGYVDVRADDPGKIIAVSSEPVLDVGRAGMFDDSGVILGDVVLAGDEWRMYYVGFQRVLRAKFLAFSGLAVSRDHCCTFVRLSETPVLDRAEEGGFIRAIHSVRPEDGVWKAWYASGNGWEEIGGSYYPRYEIRYLESADGISFGDKGELCLAPHGDEYRIGRPRVERQAGKWRMLFTYGTRAGAYVPGYAESDDGHRWRRDDRLAGLVPSASGWDSRALCYPATLQVGDRTYAFYNGNDMGHEGFGYAELTTD
jgi:hypothetical protein